MTEDGRGFLIPVHSLKRIPRSLKLFLQNPNVTKVGRMISSDAARLHAGYGLQVESCVDLATRAKELRLVTHAVTPRFPVCAFKS